MHPADDPVSLTAGILAALVGLAVAVPVIVQLLKERRFIKARDAQWDEASEEHQRQLRHVYALRSTLDERLRSVSHRDFPLEASTLQAYDTLIDTSWSTRHVGGLDVGVRLADSVLEKAESLRSDEDVAQLKAIISAAVDELKDLEDLD
jgi:hypothetical protein